MRKILAIDPGDRVSGWVELDLKKKVVVRFDNEADNEAILKKVLSGRTARSTILVVELFRPIGQPMYSQLVDTAVWAGRFVQIWGGKWEFLYREVIKHHLTGRTNSTDANVRAALIERWGGGPKKAVGLKASPGPLHGIHKHGWAALAVAVAYAEGARNGDDSPFQTKQGSNGAEPGVGVEPAEAPVDPPRRPVRRVRRPSP